MFLGLSRYQLFKLPVIFTFMGSFSTTELILHWVTGACNFLDVPFLYAAKMFWGGIYGCIPGTVYCTVTSLSIVLYLIILCMSYVNFYS